MLTLKRSDKHPEPKISRLRASAILTVAAGILVSFVLSSATSIHSAHAATGSQGSWETAQQKLWFMALDRCLTASDMLNSGIATGNVFFGDFVVWKTANGAYIEANLEGKYDDGAIACNGNNSAIFERALSALGLDKNQIYCEYKDGAYTGSGGILEDNSKYVSCQDMVASAPARDLSFKSWTDRHQYFQEVVTNVLYGGDSSNIPGGSMTTLTDLERYYIYRDAFVRVCTTGGTAAFDTTNGYQIYAWNESAQKFELGSYSENRSKSHNLKVYQYPTGSGNSEASVIDDQTCGDLAGILSTDSDEVKAYINEVADCTKRVADAVESIRSWASSHDGEYSTTAEAEISTLLAKYGSVSESAKVTFGSDGVVSFNCPSLDSLSREWEDIKTKNSLTDDTPTIDTSVASTAYSSTGDGLEATCHSTSGAFGWVFCPILEFASSAAIWAYENVIVPNLHTDPQLFETSGSRNGTFLAWEIFRDFANVVFVIYLLVIIFSQVTGFGIDNYGIKKSLPKLIAAAVLVNVSFYICQALIDVSNIAGSGIYDTINDISLNRITIPAVSANVMGKDGSIAMGIFEIVAVGTIGTLAAGGLFWTMIGTAILAALPVILGAVVGFLFLWLLLSMRQAVVVVLVAISPLAFICYSLPNTKKLFDRWAQILKGMLLLYPTAALLMAGGRLAARIIYASGATENNLPLLLTAAVAEAAPLFFIPGLTRSAYRATGALGTALNNLRNRAATGTRRGVGNWSMVSSARQRRAEETVRRRAGIDRNGNVRNLNAFQRAIRGGRNSIARNRVAYSKQQDITAAYDAAMDHNYIQNQRLAREDREHKQRIDALVYGIRRNGTLDNGLNLDYGIGGTHTNIISGRIVDLSNRGWNNLNQNEQDELEALFAIQGDANNRDGIVSVNSLTNGVTVNDGTTNHTVNTTGVDTLTLLRQRNSAVAGNLARKNGVIARYYQALASGTGDNSWNRATIGANYTQGAANDTSDVNDWSGATIREFARFMTQDQRAATINDRNFNQTITDQGKRDDIIAAFEARHTAGNARTATVPGYTGTFHSAPTGWVIDTAASAAAGVPIYRSQTNSAHTRRYNAQTNRFV